MKQSPPAIAALALALSACNQPAPAPAPSEAAQAPAATAEPSPAETTPPTSTPSPDELSAPALVPEAEKGETGARNVLLEWARAIERRDFARADAQWGAGASAAKSAKQFADYKTITVGVGDGDVEGAAGSLYYEVPLTLTGARKDGASFERHGTIVVRRVNDVDGATPAQLRWHIQSVTFEP
ncbi:hypothetical protein [Novosphingobium sp. Gsoil 351]|uniref:hypothetical protein n=1 Tax=Novosphingobium sp. Gsoil 351 TaxID=2675225 RepID=UPI0012B499B7|nr:hypothetical protein [Novosphingobium sp. Gsoil 351]QGN54698.1 hypothetical protein GKE62_09190 [Novosphingobium sp. Gsoil 351]